MTLLTLRRRQRLQTFVWRFCSVHHGQPADDARLLCKLLKLAEWAGWYE